MTTKQKILSLRQTVDATPMPRPLQLLTVVTIAGFCITLVLGLFVAGTDIQQGEIQRIFYIHMPSFFGAFTAFGMTVLGGIIYLWRKSAQWDRIALAGAEVGLAFALINLVTGSIWARPIWNTWWTWDPRLTSAAIMVLTYAAYLMLRAGIEDENRKRGIHVGIRYIRLHKRINHIIHHPCGAGNDSSGHRRRQPAERPGQLRGYQWRNDGAYSKFAAMADLDAYYLDLAPRPHRESLGSGQSPQDANVE